MGSPLLLATPAAADDELRAQERRRLRRKMSEAEPRRLLGLKAAQGDAEAQNNLGFMHQRGRCLNSAECWQGELGVCVVGSGGGVVGSWGGRVVRPGPTRAHAALRR